MNKTELKDIQNLTDSRGIDIQKVGVNNVEIPLIIQRKNEKEQTVSAKARVSVSLPRNYKGTHMSRFIEIINEWGQKNILSDDIQGCLKEVIKRLKAQSAELKFSFKYFINKKAPVSGLCAPMGYDCSFEGKIQNEEYKFILGVKVPVTTLCPCSKEISQYGAHNQRSIANVKLSYNPQSIVWIEDLIEAVEKCGSSPIYPLLKRADEKFVTEHAYKNPKFIEDLLRDIIIELRGIPDVTWFEVECESFESIHNHNAWAYQQETV
jgi:GTP cyclohydrolase I